MARKAIYNDLTTVLQIRIRDDMIAAGMDAKNLSLKAGLNATAVRDILKGKTTNPTTETIKKIADTLQKPVERYFDQDISENSLHINPIYHTKVLGEVQAGTWSEAICWEESEQYTIPMVNNKYKDTYALKVRGDSMNMFYKSGSHVIVTPLDDLPLKDGYHVIVQRRRKDGDIEATIKELVTANGKAELWPRSTNPKYQEPLSISWPYDEAQKVKTETIEIIGIVVGNYWERDL